jgi:hypothetical protein
MRSKTRDKTAPLTTPENGGSVTEPTTAAPSLPDMTVPGLKDVRVEEPISPNGPAAIVMEGVFGYGSFEAKVFKWSDGKWGANVKTIVPFDGPDAASKQRCKDEANNFAVASLQQIVDMMTTAFGKAKK